MPFKSGKQRRFFGLCRTNPAKAKAKCPKQSVVKEFFNKDRPLKVRRKPRK